MFEKRFGSFALWKIAKFENVSQHHWMEESARRERQKAARCERGANTQRVCVANFVLRDHSANFLHAKFATIENRFSFVSRRELSTELNWTRQKKVASLIRESRR